MEQTIKAIFNDKIAKAGADKFGVAFDHLTFLGAWQNFIYEYQINGRDYILRFTPNAHRAVNSIEGELDWLRYLSRHEVSVSIPVLSKQDQWVEVIHGDDMFFTVTAFVKAQGRKIGYPECLDHTNLYRMLGKTMGRMHALTKKYEPRSPTIRRHHWYDNYYLKNLKNFVPSDQTRIYDSYKELEQTLKELPQDENSYGLIHGDVGIGNYLVDETQGVITLFDFDEAQYSWFIEDIAIPLYYLVYVYGGDEGKSDREQQAARFMEHFMEGYEEENALDTGWFQHIPLFLRLREMIVYAGMNRSSDHNHLDDWSRDFLSESKARIEEGTPIVDIWRKKRNGDGQRE